MVIMDDPYQALNLPHTASLEDIKRSYRQLCKKYHPDTWSAPCFSEPEKQRATEQFQKVSGAYEILSDSNKKAEYDRNYKLGLYDTKKNHPSSTTGNDNPNNNTSGNSPSTSPPPPPPRTGAPPPLPRGWTTARDPSSGSLYYCHSSTGQSSWHHPSLRNLYNNNNNTSTNENTNNNNNKKNNGPHNDTNNNGRRGGRKNMFDEGYHYQAYHDKNDYRNNNSNKNINIKPENHRCSTVLSLCLCPPIGIIAAYHSVMVDRCWNNSRIPPKEQQQQKHYTHNNTRQEQYDLADRHSKSTAGYTCFGNTLGIIFWIYMIFIRQEFEWAKDINKTIEEWWPDDWKNK